ncbi:T9SS type A sorting domain-containing protein [candidate division KSB1 bacterium]|nr:T9SS type A sorting domain-containing protein [candidate division KSB1 bacterium]
MICLLGLLLLSSVCIAQPAEGPWTVVVAATGEVFTDLCIGPAGPDRSVMFVVQDRDTTLATCRFGVFDWIQHGILSDSFPPVWSAAGRRLTIGDGLSLSRDSWAAVVYEEDYRFANNVKRNRTLLISSLAGAWNGRELDTGIVHHSGGPFAGDHWNDDFRLLKRMGASGTFVSWLQHGNHPYFPEPLNLIALRTLDANLNPVAEHLAGDDAVYGPHSSYPIVIHADSVVVLGTIRVETQSGLCWFPPEPYGDPWRVTMCDDEWSDFQMTRSGRWIALETGMSDGVGSATEISPSGACLTLSEFSNVETWSESAWNPDLGWVLARSTDGYIELMRLDTSGNPHLSRGLVYETDLLHRIFTTDIAIDEFGQIVIAWTEGLANDSAAASLSIARCSWNTPLTVGRPLFTPTPASLSLSAFPNPFNSELRIEYELGQAERVQLAVYNTVGQRVDVLADEQLAAGKHVVNWRPGGATGIYFVQLRAGADVRTVKVMSLK